MLPFAGFCVNFWELFLAAGTYSITCRGSTLELYSGSIYLNRFLWWVLQIFPVNSVVHCSFEPASPVANGWEKINFMLMAMGASLLIYLTRALRNMQYAQYKWKLVAWAITVESRFFKPSIFQTPDFLNHGTFALDLLQSDTVILPLIFRTLDFLKLPIFRTNSYLPWKKFTFHFSNPRESTTVAFIWMATFQDFILRLKR